MGYRSMMSRRSNVLKNVKGFLHDILVKPIKGQSSPYYVVSVCVVAHLFLFLALLTVSQGYINLLSYVVERNHVHILTILLSLLGYVTATLFIPLWYTIALYRSATHKSSKMYIFRALSCVTGILFLGELSTLAAKTGITTGNVVSYIVAVLF